MAEVESAAGSIDAVAYITTLYYTPDIPRYGKRYGRCAIDIRWHEFRICDASQKDY
jgi:hypothetical protein